MAKKQLKQLAIPLSITVLANLQFATLIGLTCYPHLPLLVEGFRPLPKDCSQQTGTQKQGTNKGQALKQS